MAYQPVRKFKEGDEVIWSSQANGGWKVKVGYVVEVIPAGKSILQSMFRHELDADTKKGRKLHRMCWDET
ncbi:TPA: hypothetical protein ACW46Q_000443 [Salmonella enterica subsp. enterica serovar Nagoya]